MANIEPKPGSESFGIVDGLSDAQVERFERLAWPYMGVLLRTARYMTRHQQEAEDVVQETMLKAMKAIDSFQDGTEMQAWLMAILRRTFIDRWRAVRRHEEVSLDEIEVDAIEADPVGVFDDRWDNPEEMLDRFDDEVVIGALKSLPQEIRWTLILLDVEQMDQAEASMILEVPVGTVKSRAYRGRQMLRDRLYRIAQKRGWVSVEQGEAP